MPDEITWSEAPQSVIHTAEALIDKYHPWLQEARIAFVMRSEAQKRGRRKVLGQTCKVPAKMQPYLEYDFLIWLSEEDYTEMNDATREALIDHELYHCNKNQETDTWTLREHDVQEFAEIILRHGYWSPDLEKVERAGNAYHQNTLIDLAGQLARVGSVSTLSGAQLEKMSDSVSS